MTSPDSRFSLNDIGAELDRARLARHGDHIPRSTQLEAGSETSEITPVTTSSVSEVIDHAGPTCVCCLSRPPSAVLLPCCHLNLCYLCAPLLIIKGQKPTTPPSATIFENTAISTSPTRPPFYRALKTATANHPKSRKLSMGHCEPPERGFRGGEMKGQDLISVTEDDGDGKDRSGLRAEQTGEGRLDLRAEDDGRGARCLVCRSAISGWLRVYSG